MQVMHSHFHLQNSLLFWDRRKLAVNGQTILFHAMAGDPGKGRFYPTSLLSNKLVPTLKLLFFYAIVPGNGAGVKMMEPAGFQRATCPIPGPPTHLIEILYF